MSARIRHLWIKRLIACLGALIWATLAANLVATYAADATDQAAAEQPANDVVVGDAENGEPRRFDSVADGRNPFRLEQPRSIKPKKPTGQAVATNEKTAPAKAQDGGAAEATAGDGDAVGKPSVKPARPNATKPLDAANSGEAVATDGQVTATDAAAKPAETQRFRLPPNFRIQQVLKHDATGSLIALAFNEAGEILLSRENGPLLRAVDTNRDGIVDTVETYCDQVKTCQGILPLGGRVFVTGEGPQGLGFYRLADSDRDGTIDDVKLLLSFQCKITEHGPHGLALGPDGLIYIAVGNHATTDKQAEASSPYANAYEGDLAGPRFEDPNGIGAGIKAPGGTILRTDQDGESIELVAGGLRNPYDLAFSASGELFTHDADMEADEGLPWYRPTRVLHVTSGAEFGWRSGWAKWPEYFLDSVPGVLNTGGGSPAGMVFYNHVMMPVSYHNALFSCDWARGRIVAVRFKPDGSSFKGEREVFVEGNPMNATDIAVGPDGALYVTMGGRGTEGGLYRISWQGKVPPQITNLGGGISAALRQPQLESAWGRQRVLKVREELGANWGPQVTAAAAQKNLPVVQRLRALDLMQLIGPAPTKTLLLSLATDEQSLVRAKAAYLLGIHGDETTAVQLSRLIHDPEPRVRRLALEALQRGGQTTTIGNLAVPLSSEDRALAFAARRVVERMEADKWTRSVLGTRDKRIFANGAVAALVAHPSEELALSIVDRSRQLFKEKLSERETLDLLRVCQLAVLRGNLTPENTAAFRPQLVAMYPHASALVNRELVRLLVHLHEPSAADAMFAQAKSNLPTVEKIHLAMYLARVKPGLTGAQRFELLRYYEQARSLPGGASFGRYIERAAIEVGGQLTAEERLKMLRAGVEWPTTALAALTRLPAQPDADTLAALRELDGRLADQSTDAADRLKIGIVAILSRSGDEASLAYLRQLFESQPERRDAVAMGLAQYPDGENWPILVRSLSVVEGVAAQEVITKLATVSRVPTEPEALRQAILRGYALGDQGGRGAIALLEHWSGEQASAASDEIVVALDKWQAWFHKKYPTHPEAKPLPAQAGKWDLDEVVKHLKSPATQGNAARGSAVFVKANCAKCHRYDGKGDAAGPDLTTVAKRFQKREILEAILFPSHAISDQYASQKVITTDGRVYAGLVAKDAEGNLAIRLPTLQNVAVPRDEVDTIAPSTISAMPEGLLDSLSLSEITDLFAYLSKPASSANVAKQPPGVTERK